MKTVTQYFRDPCFCDIIIDDDVTGTRAVIRECDDGDDITLESLDAVASKAA